MVDGQNGMTMDLVLSNVVEVFKLEHVSVAILYLQMVEMIV